MTKPRIKSKTKAKSGIFREALKTLFILVGVIGLAFAGNVFLHELGHYTAAESFGLNPKIEMGSLEGLTTFSVESKPIATTSFANPGSAGRVIFIAAFGPLMNLLLLAIFAAIMALSESGKTAGKVALAGALVSILSFLINVIPFEGSDGKLILDLIRN